MSEKTINHKKGVKGMKNGRMGFKVMTWLKVEKDST